MQNKKNHNILFVNNEAIIYTDNELNRMMEEFDALPDPSYMMDMMAEYGMDDDIDVLYRAEEQEKTVVIKEWVVVK